MLASPSSDPYKLFDVVNEDNKEAAILLKNFKKDDFSLRLAELVEIVNTNGKVFIIVIKERLRCWSLRPIVINN